MAKPTRASTNGSPSALERIRAKREAIASETTEIFDIPGYDGDLCARYRRMEWTEVRKVAERAAGSRHPQSELHGQADIIAAACVELLLRTDPNDPEHFERLGEVDGEPVRYDSNLCQMMEWPDIKSARETVRALFGNDMAISMHHSVILAWMSGVAKKTIDEEGVDPNFVVTLQSEPPVSS